MVLASQRLLLCFTSQQQGPSSRRRWVWPEASDNTSSTTTIIPQGNDTKVPQHRHKPVLSAPGYSALGKAANLGKKNQGLPELHPAVTIPQCHQIPTLSPGAAAMLWIRARAADAKEKAGTREPERGKMGAQTSEQDERQGKGTHTDS